MSFNDKYRNEMNSRKLSDDFIKNLAARMAEEAGKSESQSMIKAEKTTEADTVSYRKTSTVKGLKITAAIAAAAAFVIVFSSVLNSLPEHSGTISVSPASTQTSFVTEPETTLKPGDSGKSGENTAADTSVPSSDSILTVTLISENADSKITAEETTAITVSTAKSPEEEQDDSIYTENAYEIFEAFNTADSMRVGYGIETSESRSFLYHESDNEPDYTYISVTDRRFSSLSDISDFLNRYFTENVIDSRFDLLTTHRFREQDGELYVTQTPTSFGYQWSSDEISYRDKTDTSFTMSRTYYDFGSESELVLHMVESDSYPGWKVDSAEFLPAY